MKLLTLFPCRKCIRSSFLLIYEYSLWIYCILPCEWVLNISHLTFLDVQITFSMLQVNAFYNFLPVSMELAAYNNRYVCNCIIQIHTTPISQWCRLLTPSIEVSNCEITIYGGRCQTRKFHLGCANLTKEKISFLPSAARDRKNFLHIKWKSLEPSWSVLSKIWWKSKSHIFREIGRGWLPRIFPNLGTP